MDKNSELVKEIALAIEQHRIQEDQMYAVNPAVGLANTYYFGENRKLWITNSENSSGIKILSALNGNPIIYHGPKTTLTKDGHSVFKNTKVGECIIRYSSGIHVVDTPKGKQNIEIFNNTFYSPSPSPSMACDIIMNLNEAKPRYFRRLTEIFEMIEKYSIDLIKLEEQKILEELRIKGLHEIEESKQLHEIISKIENKKQEKNDALLKAQSFIRKNAELRYQPILDPWQEEIKRSNIFNTSICIDGGPGTGKTTTMIQRIKFLIDENALSDYFPNLPKDQKEKLLNQNKSWVFFSPSELLKLFLKNNMIQEGLEASDDRVLVWADFKSTLIKKYKLVNAETQNPFIILRKNTHENLIPFVGSNLCKNNQCI